MLKQLQQKARKIESLHRDDEPEAGMAAPVDPHPRPVATPARTTDVLVRPVSTDAQPGSQPLWDEAFPKDSEAGGLGSTAMPEDPEASAAPPESKEPEEPRRPVPNEAHESVEPEDPKAVAEAPDASDDELIMDVDCATSLHWFALGVDEDICLV